MKHAWRRMKRHCVPWSILRLRRKIWSKTWRFYVFFAHLGKKNGANDRNRQGGRSPTKSFRASGSNRRKVRIAIGAKPIKQSGDIITKIRQNFILQVIFGVISEQFSRWMGKKAKKNGANDRNRTDDLFITSELLYRLSYIGLFSFLNIIPGGDLSSLYCVFFEFFMALYWI